MPKAKPYLLKLIMQNISYIAAAVLLVVLLFVEIKIGLDRMKMLDASNKSLSVEVNELQTKYNLLNTVIPSSDELDQDIRLLNGLIPEVEDYFSIIYALETLSNRTGFIVTSYIVDVKKSTKQQLQLSITGVGDSKSFLEFLKNYNFSGGRLITSDKIELNPQESSAIRINLTFYNKKVNLDYSQKFQINPKTIEEITKLKNKVQFSFSNVRTVEQGEPDYSYTKKTNPF
ncbi:MAG: hypothetical protein ACOYUB_01735 [Patescibacteria group bacterium]